MDLKTLSFLFENYRDERLFHRYICNDHIVPILKKLDQNFVVEEVGRSVLNSPVFTVSFGEGSKTVLLWSQMHGNESTTTKALFDLFNSITSAKSDFENILSECTVVIVPILNPDGAAAYTRVNANGVDLNRDAQDLSQPESKILRQIFDKIKPDYCFNLHGQRTIFSAGNNKMPATVSFLSPSEDKARLVTSPRKVGMALISELNNNLQSQIPDQIGRYDDGFNINCVGDTFQKHGIPTILFEAGHFKDDYSREQTRFYIFQSLALALHIIANDAINSEAFDSYFEIPENRKLYYDVIIRNVKMKKGVKDVGVIFQERLKGKVIQFIPKISKIGDLKGFFGHKEIDAKENEIRTHEKHQIMEGYENDFVLLNNEKLALFS